MLALYRGPGSARAARGDAADLPTPRRRGEIEPDGRSPKPSLVDAETIEDALDWLKPKERMVVMKDPAMLERLVQLKPTAAGMANAAE